MKAIIFACILLGVMTIDVSNSLWTNRDQQALAEIKESKWASFIMNYAELHLQTNGILQDLVSEINKLIEELNAELAQVHANFQRRTNNHNRDVTRLEQEIQDADRDLFNGNDLIDNVLLPQRDRFQNSLRQLKANIDENRKNLQEETLQRKKAHEEYEARSREINEAVSAIDESLQLLGSISNPQLIQLKRVQSNLGRIEKSFNNHSTFAPLIKALLELATEQNFADQGALQQIIKAFNDLRNQFVEALNDETAQENEAQAEFEARVQQLNSEFAEFQRQVLLRNAELTATEEKLAETQAYVQQRKQDRQTLDAQLTAENDDYARETEIYNDLVAQYQKELGASEKALELLSQPRFQDYVKSQLGF